MFELAIGLPMQSFAALALHAIGIGPMKRTWIIAFCTGLLISQCSYACGPGATIFDTDFNSNGGQWRPDEALKFGPTGGTVVFARHWEDFRIMSSATAQGNSDWCMRASFPPVAENSAAIALLFWMRDGANYYSLQITQAGKAMIWRQYMGISIKLLETNSEAIRTGPEAINELRVRAGARLLTAYINGARVLEIGVPIPGETLGFGFHLHLDAPSDSVKGREFRLARYKVTAAE